jgi:hypothetical protein
MLLISMLLVYFKLSDADLTFESNSSRPVAAQCRIHILTNKSVPLSVMCAIFAISSMLIVVNISVKQDSRTYQTPVTRINVFPDRYEPTKLFIREKAETTSTVSSN